MKKTQLLAVTVLTASLVGVTIYLLRKDKRKRRMTVVANAGYETAYDIHYPIKYGRG
jgi:hypothetical protein